MIMPCSAGLAFLALVYIADAQYGGNVNTSECKCFPGDDCWPTVEEWSHFNFTIGGRLISTVPLAAACHDDAWDSHNDAACAELQNNWLDPETQ